MGAIGATIFASPPIASSYCSSGSGWVAASRISFPMSSALPPPTATTRSALAEWNAAAPASSSASSGFDAGIAHHECAARSEAFGLGTELLHRVFAE
jgi:hypothetical protein